MELGAGGISWFTYVPAYGGNRDLAEKERMSMEIRKLKAADVMAHMGDGSLARLEAWLEEAPVREALERLGMVDEVASWDRQALATFRQFVRNTRGFRNFDIDGTARIDPFDVFLLCADASLLFEINAAINQAASLSGDPLKNYVRVSAGSSSETTSGKTDVSSAPRAPEGNGPTTASTLPATTAS